MPEAVGRFRRILADEVCRGVAMVAGRNCPVRRLEPAVELFAHHMAIGAGRRVIGQIGPTPGVGESVCANADSDANNYPEQDALDRANLHLDSPRRIANGSNPSWSSL